MQQLQELQERNKHQITSINQLWEQFLELQLNYKQRNHPKKESIQSKFSYSIFLDIMAFLNINDLLKLRILSKQMKEIMTNYLMRYRLEQKEIADQLQLNIIEEKEQLPKIYLEILNDKIVKARDCIKKIVTLNDPPKMSGYHEYSSPYYTNPILLMQVAECEGIHVQQLLPDQVNQIKHSIVFLDFSKMGLERKKELLEFYENEANLPEKIESSFINLALIWLKQSFHVNTYPSFLKIMKLIRQHDILRQRIKQLKIFKVKERQKDVEKEQ